MRQSDTADSESPRSKLLLISGLKSQPSKSYAKIDFGDEYERVLLEFSLLGFNPQVAGAQLDALMLEDGDAAVCAVSLGAKVVEYSNVDYDSGVILVNPCSHPQALNKEYTFYPLFRYLAPALELASYALGWVSVLPILTDDMGDKTSIALIVDQIFWGAHIDVEFTANENVGVVISTSDEIMLNDVLYDLYEGAHFAEINTLHGRIGSARDAKLYETAIMELLNQITT